MYGKSSIVSRSTFTAVVNKLGDSCSDHEQLVDFLLSIFGGTKGTFEYCLYTRQMYTDTPGDIPDPDELRDLITAAGPTVIEHPASVPAKTDGNACDAVKSRHYDVNPGPIEVDARTAELAQEFANYLHDLTLANNSGHLLEPITKEDVIMQAASAKVRERLLNAHAKQLDRQRPNARSFIKVEFYTRPKKIRNIIPVDPEHNLLGFRFDLPFKEIVLRTINA